MKAGLMLVNGKLNMRDSTVTLDGINSNITYKIPCLVSFSDSFINIDNCAFKGD